MSESSMCFLEMMQRFEVGKEQFSMDVGGHFYRLVHQKMRQNPLKK